MQYKDMNREKGGKMENGDEGMGAIVTARERWNSNVRWMRWRRRRKWRGGGGEWRNACREREKKSGRMWKEFRVE